jgi:hypothetical protein
VKRARTYSIVCSLLILLVLISVLLYFRFPIALAYSAARDIPSEEKRILYRIDHKALAQELRRFAALERWNNPNRPETADFFYGDDPKLPDSVRQFRPGWIQVSDDRVDFGCGRAVFDQSTSFGISVWHEGLEGHGTKKLTDGVWFYAEDGHVPSRFSFPW